MLDALARLLGLSRTDAEASMYSERAARHVLNRRDAIGLAAAMCAGTVLGDVVVPERTLAEGVAILNAIKAEMDACYEKLGRQFSEIVWAPSGITDLRVRVLPPSITAESYLFRRNG